MVDRPGTLRFGPVRLESAIVEHVVEAAKIADMDPALLMAIADKESSFAPGQGQHIFRERVVPVR